MSIVLIWGFVALQAGCSSTGNFFESTVPEDMNLNIPAQTLIDKGMEDYNKGKYFIAIEYFDKVLESHRFTPQAPLAELKMADCSYHLARFTEAYLFYEQFEEMHPTNEAIPYVMYQKGMCYFRKINRIDRDISPATKAIERFQMLLKAFPYSPYTEDTKAKIASAEEFLAHHEFAVAKFYLRTDKANQAKLRLKFLISMYPQTTIAGKAQQLLDDISETTN